MGLTSLALAGGPFTTSATWEAIERNSFDEILWLGKSVGFQDHASTEERHSVKSSHLPAKHVLALELICMGVDLDEHIQQTGDQRDFSGGSGGLVLKNSPANAGDMGSIPGPGRLHMPQGSWAHVLQLLSHTP